MLAVASGVLHEAVTALCQQTAVPSLLDLLGLGHDCSWAQKWTPLHWGQPDTALMFIWGILSCWMPCAPGRGPGTLCSAIPSEAPSCVPCLSLSCPGAWNRAEIIFLDEEYPVFLGETPGRVPILGKLLKASTQRKVTGYFWHPGVGDNVNRFCSVIGSVILQVNSSIHVPPSAQLSVLLSFLDQHQHHLLANFHRQNLIKITRNQGPLPSHPFLLLLVIVWVDFYPPFAPPDAVTDLIHEYKS